MYFNWFALFVNEFVYIDLVLSIRFINIYCSHFADIVVQHDPDVIALQEVRLDTSFISTTGTVKHWHNSNRVNNNPKNEHSSSSSSSSSSAKIGDDGNAHQTADANEKEDFYKADVGSQVEHVLSYLAQARQRRKIMLANTVAARINNSDAFAETEVSSSDDDITTTCHDDGDDNNTCGNNSSGNHHRDTIPPDDHQHHRYYQAVYQPAMSMIDRFVYSLFLNEQHLYYLKISYII